MFVGSLLALIMDDTGYAQPHSPFRVLPGDVLIEIASLLDSRQNILHFGLTSKFVFEQVSTVLYKRVILSPGEQCTQTLGMLRRRADISRHVRELTIRTQPNSLKAFSSSIDNSEASAAVSEIAASGCLDALVKFVWDDDELPHHDEMWFALRMGCPQLRYISTSLGAILPSVNTHLSDFQDLKGFTITLKTGFYENHHDLFLDEEHPTSKQLWNMIIDRCPNLEELSIEGSYSVPTDIHYIAEGRWPHLRKLALGDVCIDWVPRSLSPGEKRPFIAFLEAHPLLESLGLSRHTVQPIHLASLDPASLGRVTSFTGTHQQLQALPQIHPELRKVVFVDAVETRDVSAPTVASLLRELTALTDLRICFSLHSMYDSGSLLRCLISSCPVLRHLELTCAHKPSFQLDAFAKTIRGFRKLRTLSLTIVRYSGDETLASGAVHIAKSNPRLKRFSLTFIPPLYPVSLPFSFAFRPLSLVTPFIARDSGTFDLDTDTHGLPLRIHAVEQTTLVWPWGLGVSKRTRNYITDLRPRSIAKPPRIGLSGFCDLLFEKSSAGEDARMMTFCTALVCFAVWGFVVAGSGRGQNRELREILLGMRSTGPLAVITAT